MDMVLDSDARETSMYATTKGCIYALMSDGYEVNNDRLPVSENKPSSRDDTEQPVYKQGWAWNGIDYRRASVFQLDTSNLDGMNK